MNGFPTLVMMTVARLIDGRLKLSQVPATILEDVEAELELQVGKNVVDGLRGE